MNEGALVYQPFAPFGEEGWSASEVSGALASILTCAWLCVSSLPALSVDQ